MSQRDLADILLKFEKPPARLVSLVPSYTDSLYSLSMGKTIVGVTDYCPVAVSDLGQPVRVGGPKTINVEDVLKLQPDLVLANFEENTREVVEALEAKDVPVWVSFPRTVEETVSFLWGLVDLFRSQPASLSVKMIDSEVDWAQQVANDTPRRRYFCPVWQEYTADDRLWWMTFNDDTYSGNLLRLVGGENIFAGRERRYPLDADLGLVSAEAAGDRDRRYPRVTVDEVLAGEPEIVLLPDEPFLFDESGESAIAALLADTPAGKSGKIFRVDGKLITWCGTMLGKALAELPTLFAE